MGGSQHARCDAERTLVGKTVDDVARGRWPNGTWVKWYVVSAWRRVHSALTTGEKCRRLRAQKGALLARVGSGYTVRLDSLGLDGTAVLGCNDSSADAEKVYLGEIDQDGHICARVDGLFGLPLVPRDAFMPREKFKIRLVAVGGDVGIEKCYGNRKREFLNELSTLLQFNELGFNVPAVLDYDLEQRTLTMSYVDGEVLREALARKGARLLDKQVGKQSEHNRRQRKAIANRRIAEALHVMDEVIDSKGIAAIHEQIRRIHDAGYALVDIKYGNIILEKTTGKPFLVDFESAIRLDEVYSRSAAEFLKKRDMEQFERIFGLSKAA